MPALSSSHALVSLSYDINIERNVIEYWYRDYKYVDIGSCMLQIGNIDFSELYSLPNVDDQLNFFNQIVKTTFDENVPL